MKTAFLMPFLFVNTIGTEDRAVNMRDEINTTITGVSEWGTCLSIPRLSTRAEPVRIKYKEEIKRKIP